MPSEIVLRLSEQEALLICDVFDGQPFGSLLRVAGLDLTQRIRAQIAAQQPSKPKGRSVSTNRLDEIGVVHAMADLGVAAACGANMPEPWQWTDKGVTCEACKAARRTHRR